VGVAGAAIANIGNGVETKTATVPGPFRRGRFVEFVADFLVQRHRFDRCGIAGVGVGTFVVQVPEVVAAMPMS
jgi:hypothetical protein